jgi:cell division septation protein DedD
VSRFLTVGLICFLVALIPAQAASSDPGTQSEQAVDLFLQGRIDEAREILKKVHSGRLDPRGRYYAGRLARQDGVARGHFQAVSRLSGSGYADDALMELAESAYAGPQGLYVSARRAFQRVVDSFPESPHAALATYRIGRSYLITSTNPADSHVDSARTYLRKVMTHYPSSPVAAQAAHILATEAGARADTSTGPTWLVGTNVTGAQPTSFASTKTFWVQAGGFSKRFLADGLASRLRQNSMGVRLVSSGKVTLVQVGPYSTQERAESASRHISLVESLDCQVIQE